MQKIINVIWLHENSLSFLLFCAIVTSKPKQGWDKDTTKIHIYSKMFNLKSGCLCFAALSNAVHRENWDMFCMDLKNSRLLSLVVCFFQFNSISFRILIRLGFFDSFDIYQTQSVYSQANGERQMKSIQRIWIVHTYMTFN